MIIRPWAWVMLVVRSVSNCCCFGSGGRVMIGDRLAAAVDDADINRDDVNAGAERRLLRLLILSLLPVLSLLRSGDRRRGEDSEREEGPLHGSRADVTSKCEGFVALRPHPSPADGPRKSTFI